MKSLTKIFMMVLFGFREGDCEILKSFRAFYTKVLPASFLRPDLTGQWGCGYIFGGGSPCTQKASLLSTQTLTPVL